MGLSSYNILSDKLAPTKPLEADYKQIVDTLASYYEPKSYELVELYKFHKRYKKNRNPLRNSLQIYEKWPPRATSVIIYKRQSEINVFWPEMCERSKAVSGSWKLDSG